MNMEALLAALLETAEIKPFCSCIVAWLTLHQVEAMICIIVRDLIQVKPEWSSGFPHFLQFKSEFGNKEFMI